MTSIKRFLRFLLGLAMLLVGIIAIIAALYYIIIGLYWLVAEIGGKITSLDSEASKLATGAIVGILTLSGAIFTVLKSTRANRALEIESHFREPKREMYNEFLKEIFDVFQNVGIDPSKSKKPDTDPDKLFASIIEFNRKVLLWGGPGVVQAYIKWKCHLENTVPNAETLFLMGDFILAKRKDLGLSNKGINRQILAAFILRNPDLFLEMSNKNPNVTLDELAQEEQARGLI